MRTFHWALLGAIALFLSTALAAQQPAAPKPQPTPKSTPPPAAAAARASKAPIGMRPVVHVNDIMHGIVEPASTVVFDAVATTIDSEGVHEKRPQTDEEWDTVLRAAVTLTEAGNLLMIPGRRREVGGQIPAAKWADWNRKASELIRASGAALKAAREKSAQGLLDAGEDIDVACDACHEPYQIVEVPGEPPKK